MNIRFKRMSAREIEDLLSRTGKGPHGSKIERYKKPEQGASHRVHHDGEALA
ncbi:MAG: hypothetical protein M1541_11590 [Acidobacteria bacterium]|nr:hypothetical protein [Acidobacteriota bacterium]